MKITLLSSIMTCLKHKYLALLILLPFTSISAESTLQKRFELVTALQKYFSSGCVVWQLLPEERPDYLLQRNQNIIQLQRFLSTTKTFSTVVGAGSLNITLPCQRNRPLYVLWCSGDTQERHLRQLFLELHPSDARWLLFMDNTPVSIEEFLGGMNIPFDCEFLVAIESQEAVELREVYRVHYTLPLVTSHWGRWSTKDGLSTPHLSLILRRNDMRGIKFITAGIHQLPVMSLGEEDSDGNVEAKGYTPGLWRELSRRLNFSLIARRPPDHAYGSQLPNGSWNGIVGMILDGKADASISFVSMTSSRADYVDFSAPLFIMWKDVFIRMRYDSQDSWKIYVAPFSISLWLTVAVCVLVITCCLAIMYYLLSTEKTSSLHDTFFSVLGAFCSQGVGSFPLHMSLRLAVWVTLLTGLLVVASYGARVTSSLAVKTPVLPFNDLEGLLKDKSYGFGMDGRTESVKIFRQSPGVRGMLYKQKILPNLNNLPMGNEEGFQRVCKEKYAYFCGRISVTPDNTPCELKRLPEASSYKYTVFILRKRSPYRRIINYTLRRMMLGGIYRKLYLQWLVFPDNSEPPPLESVDMSDVSALLLLFLAGGLTSLCVFLVELAIKMRQCFKVPICRQQI